MSKKISRAEQKKKSKQNVMQLLVGNDSDSAGSSSTQAPLVDPVRLKIAQLRSFSQHPFQLYREDRLADMVESIREHGVLVPILVRPLPAADSSADTEYEILSGHNRVNAAQQAGLSEVPAIIKTDLTDDLAMMYVVETNLMQRSFSDLLPSEQATILGMRHETLFSQGKRNDIRLELERLATGVSAPERIANNSTTVGSTSLAKAGAEYGLSKNTVARLLRLNHLISPLQALVDQGLLSLRAGVLISYLSPPEQELLEQVLRTTKRRLTIKQATALRELSAQSATGGNLFQQERVLQILTGERATSKTPDANKKTISISAKLYQQYFAHITSQQERDRILEQALAAYDRDRLNQNK